MTAEQARRTAKILRDMATSLPCDGGPESGLKLECHILARALDNLAGVQAIIEAPEREAFDATVDSGSWFAS